MFAYTMYQTLNTVYTSPFVRATIALHIILIHEASRAICVILKINIENIKVWKKNNPVQYFSPRLVKKRHSLLHFISWNELSRMRTLLSLTVAGFVFAVSFAVPFSDDDLEAQNIDLKEIAGDFADDFKLQNPKR